jgi:hypothetical protein
MSSVAVAGVGMFGAVAGEARAEVLAGLLGVLLLWALSSIRQAVNAKTRGRAATMWRSRMCTESLQ